MHQAANDAGAAAQAIMENVVCSEAEASQDTRPGGTYDGISPRMPEEARKWAEREARGENPPGDSAADYVNQSVSKKFPGAGRFTGKVESYGKRRGLFTVVYSDGDREDLHVDALRKIVQREGVCRRVSSAGERGKRQARDGASLDENGDVQGGGKKRRNKSDAGAAAEASLENLKEGTRHEGAVDEKAVEVIAEQDEDSETNALPGDKFCTIHIASSS